jgi:glycosyltransferase involved in cell wall biosynthesis
MESTAPPAAVRARLDEARRWLAEIAAPGPERALPGWHAGCARAVEAALRGTPPAPRPEGFVGRPSSVSAPAWHLAGLASALASAAADPASRERARWHARWLEHLLAPGDPAALPRVSVVIPVHDAALLVVEAVASALAQTHPSVEVIVVDDGSRDDPAAALARLADSGDRLRVLRQENRGAAAARNRGVAAARGELVQFLDADDALDPDAVERKLAAFRAVPEAELCASRYRATGGDPPPGKRHGPPFGDAWCPTRDLLAAWVRRYPFHTSTVLVPRFVLAEAGPWDEGLEQGEDARYWLALALRGTRVVAIDAPLATRRFRAGSLSSSESPLGPIIYLGALVELLARPAHWRHVGALLARLAGRGRWAVIESSDDPRLAALRAALLERVASLGRERRDGLSGRMPLAMISAGVPRGDGAPADFRAQLARALREALAGAPRADGRDREFWLEDPLAAAPENAAALAALPWAARLAWRVGRLRRRAEGRWQALRSGRRA